MHPLLESGKVRGIQIEGEWRILGAALLNLTDLPPQETEASLLSDWLTASSHSLKEVWDNEEDSVYDQL